MDGVIVDTEPLHHKAYYGMFNELNIEVSQEHYQSFTGQSTINVCKSLCNHFELTNEPQELVNIKRSIFKRLFKNDPELQLIQGVHDLIKDYHSNGLTLVLASSASMGTIDSVFDRFGLNKYFKSKISGADLKASKPHPEIFEKAADLAGFNRKNCLVIEDSTNGIQAANAAGIFCVGFKSPNSKNQNYSTADKVITSFEEIVFNKAKDFFQLNSV